MSEVAAPETAATAAALYLSSWLTSRNPRNSTHKRSMSAAALNLLRRKDTRGEDDSGSEDGRSQKGGKSAAPTMAHNPSVRSTTSRLSTTGASLSRQASNSAAAAAAAASSGSVTHPLKQTQSNDKGVSLEQSVKKFRVVEALRSGDTSSISKAIRESETGPRTSISSLSGASSAGLEDTTILHLAIQCAEFPVVEYVLSDGQNSLDVNSRDKDGNTPLHVASTQGRTQIVKLLLEQKGINDAIANSQGKLPIDLARNPEIFQQLQLSRSLYTEDKVREVQELIAKSDYENLAQVLEEPRFKTVIDINSPEFASEPVTVQHGGTLLHEAAKKKNTKLIQTLLLHGADPFRRDRKGKLPQNITSDDNIKALLKKSPAAVAAQRGIQEKAVLGHAASQGAVATASGDPLAGRESREMKGYLKKWTNYRKGYQLRFFVLEDGVLSYYKHQDDAGSACRGAINMRIAKLHMSADEKTKFEIHGKSSVKYTLKANHEVEAKRWFWSLNNSIQWSKDQVREEEKQAARSAELLKQAKAEQSGSSLTIQDSNNSESASMTDIGRTSSHQPSRSVSSAKITGHRNDHTGTSTVGSIDDDDFADAATDGDASRFRGGPVIPGERDDDDDDDMSEHEEPSATRDALNITAQSAKLQLETMSHVHAALAAEAANNPSTSISDAKVAQALTTYDGSIRSLTGLIGDLLRIAKDRDAYWQYRLERESSMRRMWEESMAQVAREQEELEVRYGEAEAKRKLTKKALREVMEGAAETPASEKPQEEVEIKGLARKPTALEQMAEFSDDESEDQEEFFDAVDAGEVEVAMPEPAESSQPKGIVVSGGVDISSSFKGYENGIRHRLKLDADNRPKVGLWVSILGAVHAKVD